MMNFNTFLKKEPYFHIVLWIVVFVYPYVQYSEANTSITFLHELNGLFFKMLISYFLYLYVFPRKNQTKIILIGFFVLMINPFLFEFFDAFFHNEPYMTIKEYMTGLALYVSFGVLFYAIYTFKSSLKKQFTINQLVVEKQQAELENLKAQVNPHFLFNTLNTIYARAIKTDEKTADLLLKLSNGFRYFLHEGQQETVSIQQEITHLQDYISLQKERLSKKITVNFTTNIDDKNARIAPLLLITFVENTFKYSSVLKGNNHPVVISIHLKNKQLEFTCSNPYTNSNEANEWLKSGIGITNTKKRLQLMYPKKHQLVISENKAIFTVKLSIEL